MSEMFYDVDLINGLGLAIWGERSYLIQHGDPITDDAPKYYSLYLVVLCFKIAIHVIE